MKREKFFLAGAIVWSVIALLILVFFVLALTGALNLPELFGGRVAMGLNINTQLVKEESYSVDALDSISVSTSSHNVALKLVNGDKVTVRQYDSSEQNLFTATESGKSLDIEVKSTITIGISIGSPRLEIDIPEKYSEDILISTSSGAIDCSPEKKPSWARTNISSSSGAIKLTAGIDCTELVVASSSGSVTVGSVSASELNISTTSGSMHLDKLSGDMLTVHTSSGTQHLGDIDISGSVSLESTSGSINTGSIESKNFDISSSSGSIRLDGISGSGNIGATSGSVNCGDLYLDGDVSIKTNSGSQRVNLPDGQDFELEITTNSGSIRTGDIEVYYSDKNGKNAHAEVGNGSGGTLSMKSTSGGIHLD